MSSQLFLCSTLLINLAVKKTFLDEDLIGGLKLLKVDLRQLDLLAQTLREHL